MRRYTVHHYQWSSADLRTRRLTHNRTYQTDDYEDAERNADTSPLIGRPHVQIVIRDLALDETVYDVHPPPTKEG